MHTTTVRIALAAAVTATFAACSSTPVSPGVDTDVVLLSNADTAAAQLQAGCWATFYDERNFNGSSLTLVGPADVQTFDKGSAQQLRRDIRSIATGPRATLTLYEKQFLSARNVRFLPSSREPQLVEQLGFGGQIESMQLRCAS